MNAPKWLSHIQTVLGTIGSGRYGKINDQKTYGVLSRAIPDMFTTRGLDGKLKESLLLNIEIRAMVKIDHEGPIVLNRNQRKYARDKGWDRLPSFEVLFAEGQQRHGTDDVADAETNAETDAELMEAFQQYFSIVSASFQHQFSTVSASMTRNSAEKLTFWLSSNGMSCDVNHESQDVMTSAKPTHEGVATQTELHDGTEPATIHPGHEEEVLVRGKRDPRKADALSIFVKERKGKVRASGNLELGGSKWPLTFNPFYGALEAIPQTQANAEWHRVMSGTVADIVVPEERRLTGVAARSTMSGLYGPKDSFGYKPPVMEQTAVVLHWEGDLPVAATIIDGEDRYRVELKQESSDRFKGTVKLTEGA